MGIKEELRRDEKQDFCENNGLVMRTILACFKRGWFKTKELLYALEARELEINDVIAAVDYFADKGYIKTRDAETHEEVLPCDIDFDELEFRLHADGVQLGKHLIDDIGIDL